MHLTFFDRAFSSHLGGIERVCSEITTYMASKGHECTILSVNSDRNASPVIELADSVRLVNIVLIDTPFGRENLRKWIVEQKPDVFIALTGTVGRLPMYWPVVLAGTGIPFLASEHNCPEIIVKYWNNRERLIYMNAADSIHVLFPSYAQSLPSFLRNRVTVIPNPIGRQFLNNEKKKLVGRHVNKIIAVGSLIEQPKQFHLLVDAFSTIANYHPDWGVEIWGTGPEKDALIKQIDRLGMTEKILLCGVTHDLQQHYLSADIFCMPSSFEGCPCAMQEAMASGLPCVGFADCPGVNEIIRHKENGLLAESMTVESLAKQLLTLIEDPDMRDEYGKNARVTAEKFEHELLLSEWEKLILHTSTFKDKSILSCNFTSISPECLRYDLDQICKKEQIWQPCYEEQVKILEQKLSQIKSFGPIKLALGLRRFLINCINRFDFFF